MSISTEARAAPVIAHAAVMTPVEIAVVRSLVEKDAISLERTLASQLLDTIDAYVAWSDAWERIAQTGDVDVVLAQLRAERVAH